MKKKIEQKLKTKQKKNNDYDDEISSANTKSVAKKNTNSLYYTHGK